MSRKKKRSNTALIIILSILAIGFIAFFGGLFSVGGGYSLLVSSAIQGDDAIISVGIIRCTFVSGEGCVDNLKGLVIIDENPETEMKFSGFGNKEFIIDTSELSVGQHKVTMLSQKQDRRVEGQKFFMADVGGWKFYTNYLDGRYDGHRIPTGGGLTCADRRGSLPVQCSIDSGIRGEVGIVVLDSNPDTATLGDGRFYKNYQLPPVVLEETFFVIAPPDSDGDGIPDSIDACPTEPETFNGFEDEDGCPDERPNGGGNGEEGCTTNNECEIELNSCFGVCQNSECKIDRPLSVAEVFQNKPCEGATWEGFGVCTWETSDCSATSRIPLWIYPLVIVSAILVLLIYQLRKKKK